MSHDAIEDVVSPEWRVEIQAAVPSLSYADHATNGQKIVDPICGFFEFRVAGDAELAFVPEMNPGLIADIDLAVKILKDLSSSAIDMLFRLGGRIRVVEIEDIVVLDSALWALIGKEIPDRLEKTAADKPGIRHAEFIQAGENFVYSQVALNEIQKSVFRTDL